MEIHTLVHMFESFHLKHSSVLQKVSSLETTPSTESKKSTDKPTVHFLFSTEQQTDKVSI